MLIASSINGFVFGLASGQPLLILGPTGPFLVFEEMVYDVNRKISFLFICLFGISFLFVLVMSIIKFRFLDSTMLC
jgi:MFS superfamily sulfate permease-like transporter